MKKIFLFFAMLFVGTSLCACSGISSALSSMESASTSSSSSDTASNAVFYASELYTISAKTTTTVVESGVLTKTQLEKLQTLRAAVRVALEEMQTQLAAGETVDMATFNTAWTAFKTYLSTIGITISQNEIAKIRVAELAINMKKG